MPHDAGRCEGVRAGCFCQHLPYAHRQAEWVEADEPDTGDVSEHIAARAAGEREDSLCEAARGLTQLPGRG